MKLVGIQSPESIFGVFCFLKKEKLWLSVCPYVHSYVCVCVVLMKLGMNCVMLHQVGVGEATGNLEHKVMIVVIGIGKIYNFCYGKASLQGEITM